ncbi:MAG TPA: DinB family protein [Candidatus Dormibacteraeota bacterium]|nr:DinB family protein [Candidatus Dormibacteraeota bacterium]
MMTFRLFLESGPKRRKTMVHVPELLGCVAVGPTTDDALLATPDAIRAFRAFVAARLPGDAAGGDPGDAFETVVAEHITEGDWLGNGSPYITLACDLEPVSEAELETYVGRHRALRAALSTWAAGQGSAALDAKPSAGGRTARAILLHALGAGGGYLAAALGSGPAGYSALAGAAERGEVEVAEAMRRSADLIETRLQAITEDDRDAIRERSGTTRTLRKALRRLLEHDWEHLAELSRRPGGPALR